MFHRWHWTKIKGAMPARKYFVDGMVLNIYKTSPLFQLMIKRS